MLLFNQLTKLLLQEFPELWPAFEKEAEHWGDEAPGPHIVFGDIFNEYVLHLLANADDAALGRAFAFVERMAADGDALTRELVEVTICERILDTEGAVTQLEPHLGVTTRRIMADIGKRWNI